MDDFRNIRWLKDTALEITVGFDEEEDKAFIEDETFPEGETCEVDILDERGEDNSKTYDMQFGDGSVAYCVPASCFEFVED